MLLLLAAGVTRDIHSRRSLLSLAKVDVSGGKRFSSRKAQELGRWLSEMCPFPKSAEATESLDPGKFLTLSLLRPFFSLSFFFSAQAEQNRGLRPHQIAVTC